MGDEIAVAEICDYETRRELIRRGSERHIANLDQLISASKYISIDNAAMRQAAILWANLRNNGKQFADNRALDGDVILGAQVEPFADHLVVTENVSHLAVICNAVEWTAL